MAKPAAAAAAAAKSFQLCPTLCNPMDQALPSMGFSRQEYWSRLPCSPPGDLPNPGIEPRSPALQADTLTSEPRQEEFQSRPSNSNLEMG